MINKEGMFVYLDFDGKHLLVISIGLTGKVVHDDGMGRGGIDLGQRALGGRASGLDVVGEFLDPFLAGETDTLKGEQMFFVYDLGEYLGVEVVG